MKMTCELKQSDQLAQFIIVGELYEKEAAELKKIFETLKLDCLQQVVFDFGGVTFIGSTAMGTLLIFYRRLAIKNIEMRLVNTPSLIANLLRSLKLDALFPIE